MKTLQLSIFGLMLFFISSCKEDKDEIVYKGIVERQTTDCTSGLGFPVVIKVYNSLEYDSIYTATLPKKYQLNGTEIEFKMKPLKTSDESIVCNATVFNPKFMVVYDIKNIDELN